MTVLITGYEPFGEHEKNPTAMIAERLDGETIAGEQVVGRVLPVAFDVAGEQLRAYLSEYTPSVAIACGLAAGRSAVSVERIGVNVNDAVTTPDNAGNDPVNEQIAVGGPAAYLSTLPIETVVTDLLDASIPAYVSNTAGTHLCNNALYTLGAAIEDGGYNTKFGFLHLPLTTKMAAENAHETAVRGAPAEPSLPLELQQRAVERAVKTAVTSTA
ncbi:peptidase [Halorubraceae archaeon YAN]|nr:peptidase [Halorubraceae archaeon YAN]